MENAVLNIGNALFGVAGGTTGGDELGGMAYTLLSVFCYIVGILILCQSLGGLSRASQFSGGCSPTQSLDAGPIVGFLIAGALLGLPDTWLTINSTIFDGRANDSILAYSGVAFSTLTIGNFTLPADATFDAFMLVIILIIQLIGWIAFVRGLLMIKRAAEGSGQASYGTAITHIIGGILAANLIATVDVIQQTVCNSACIVNV